MIRVGIIGATGYAGIDLVRLILNHPHAAIEWVTSESYKGQKLSDVYPHLAGRTDLICSEMDLKKLAPKVDVIFIALPNGMAMSLAPAVVEAGKKVIDMGADFRLKDPDLYKKWYGDVHSSTKLLKQAVYGLPELHREEIAQASVVGNPGCYPTASILGLAPLMAQGIVELDSIIVDAKSGVSGAGRTASLHTHFSEANEAISAYKVASHRHTPEIEQELSALAGEKFSLTFTPHLVPMTRGILATLYAKRSAARKNSSPLTVAQLESDYRAFYKDSPFVRIQKELPTTKQVSGTNYCDIAIRLDEATQRIIVLSVIDNLVKGAAGQAVQNLNLMFGLPENSGLTQSTIYP